MPSKKNRYISHKSKAGKSKTYVVKERTATSPARKPARMDDSALWMSINAMTPQRRSTFFATNTILSPSGRTEAKLAPSRKRATRRKTK